MLQSCFLGHGPHVPATDGRLSLRGYYGAFGLPAGFDPRASLQPQQQHPRSVLSHYQRFWFLYQLVFLWSRVISRTPNPQPGGPGGHSLCGLLTITVLTSLVKKSTIKEFRGVYFLTLHQKTFNQISYSSRSRTRI